MNNWSKLMHQRIIFLSTITTLIWLHLWTISGFAADVRLSWNATDPAPDGYKVYYGTSSQNYTSSLTVANQITAMITGLNEGTRYYFVVRAYNSLGESGSSNEVHTLVVSNVLSGSITANSATITWMTDAASDSQVTLGTSTAYGSLSPVDSASVTQHSATPTGLAPSTLYHFKVLSKDLAGNGSSSNDYTFTTAAGAGSPADAQAAVISSVGSSLITGIRASISWNTDEASDSQVEYGITASYGSSSALDSSMTTTHTVSLSGLSAGTTYHFRTKSKDASGNLATSVDATFTTLLPPPPNVTVN